MAVARTIPTQADVDLITFTIKVDGQEISKTLQVMEIIVHKEINKIPYARLRILDGNPSKENFEVTDTGPFIPGKSIEISLGYHSQETTVFKGLIITLSNSISSSSSSLLVECRDAAVKMTIGPHSNHYNQVTDSDVASQLIGNYPDLTPDVESTTVQHKDLIQYYTTDWDFMVSRMDSIGLITVVSDGTCSIKTPALSDDPKLDVLFGATILNYKAEMDSRNQYKSLKASAWNFSSQQIDQLDGQEPNWTEGGNISNSDLAQVIGLDPYLLAHSGKLEQDELQAWADARLMKNRLSKISGTVKFQGYPDLLPGDFIGLNGVGDRFNGKAIVQSIHHECRDGSWTTEVGFGLNAQWFAETLPLKHPITLRGGIPSIHGLQIGVVTDIVDPDSEHRVRVRLPIVNESQDGVWARIATLDAGDQRGSFFRPEVGDEVIIGSIHSDSTQLVILGMLHSSALAAPLQAATDNPEKGYVSREKIKMIFNDKEKAFKLETPGGKKITLSDQDGSVKIEDDSGNFIKMESSGITISSAGDLKLKASGDVTIDATNVTITPTSDFSVSAAGCEIKAGSGSASLSAPSIKMEGSGMAELKGGMVKIN